MKIRIVRCVDDVGCQNPYPFTHRVSGTDSKPYLDQHSGYVGLMCPHCYRITHVNGYYHLESEVDDKNISGFGIPKFYTESCATCGRETRLIDLDPNIADAISNFNRAGFKTEFCCEGHPEYCDDYPDGTMYNNPYVMFHNRVNIRLFDTLPITWYFDVETFKQVGLITIRSEECNKEEAMIDLLDWSNALVDNSGHRSTLRYLPRRR